MLSSSASRRRTERRRRVRTHACRRGMARQRSAARAQSAPGQGPGGPILVVVDPSDPFGRYYAEILRAEGLNEFAVADVSTVTPATLAGADAVVLAQMALSAVAGRDVHELRGSRREPDRDAPRQAAGAAARARRHRRDPRERLHADRHERRRPARGSPARRCSSTTPRTATPSPGRRPSRRCTPMPARPPRIPR